MTPRSNPIRMWWPIILLIVCAPPVLMGALSVESNTTDMRQWLPRDRAERHLYDWFLEHFGADDFVLVSWPGCALNDESLAEFAACLEQHSANQTSSGRPRLFRRVLTGSSLLEQLMGKPANLTKAEAIERLKGIVIGNDGSTTCALVEFTSEGTADPHRVIGEIYAIAQDKCGISPEQLRLGGGVYEAVVIDRESNRTMHEYIVLSCLVALAVAFACLRSVRLTIFVLISAVYCGALSVALVKFTGGRLNAVMIVMPTLIYVLVISSAVHLVNYYRDAIRTGGVDGAPRRALRAGWLPCTLAAGTTAVGMLSLGVSQIDPVRSFGLYAAAGILVSLFVLFTFFPAALTVWPTRQTAKLAESKSGGYLYENRGAIASWIVRQHRWLVAICLSCILLAGFGFSRITTSVQLEHMFRPENELLRNYRWLEQHIGPLAALEVIVHFDNDCTLTIVDRLQVVRRIEQQIELVDEIDATISATTLTPPLPLTGGVSEMIHRRLLDKKMNDARPQLIADRYLAESSNEELWRITARLSSLREMDYSLVIDDIHRHVQSVLAQQTRDRESLSVSYTGAFPVLHRAQHQLLDDLIKSFAAAFLVICPLMMILLRAFWAGLVTMIPNVAPAVMVFGGMGWLRIPVDIGTVLTASVALGIAVDGTLHFLTWYRRGLREGQSSVQAVGTAYRCCAVAMVQTTLICGLGLIVFLGSSFVPAGRFAVLMFLLLLAALIGDLVLLPAMLAGVLGRLFKQETSDSRESFVDQVAN